MEKLSVLRDKAVALIDKLAAPLAARTGLPLATARKAVVGVAGAVLALLVIL